MLKGNLFAVAPNTKGSVCARHWGANKNVITWHNLRGEQILPSWYLKNTAWLLCQTTIKSDVLDLLVFKKTLFISGNGLAVFACVHSGWKREKKKIVLSQAKWICTRVKSIRGACHQRNISTPRIRTQQNASAAALATCCLIPCLASEAYRPH